MTRRQPYCPQTAQIPAALIRVETCDTWKAMPARTSATGHRAVVPLGQGGRGETPSYRASAPNGAGDVGSRSTVHCSLLTVHWSFTFSAKEKDIETGLSYFGSRYYSSDLSIWLSVDPMSDKYASLSPYTYCADNPVKLVDPNGEEIVEDDPPGRISNFLNNLENKIYGTDENRQFEGGGDGANQGTMTMQDVEVFLLWQRWYRLVQLLKLKVQLKQQWRCSLLQIALMMQRLIPLDKQYRKKLPPTTKGHVELSLL